MSRRRLTWRKPDRCLALAQQGDPRMARALGGDREPARAPQFEAQSRAAEAERGAPVELVERPEWRCAGEPSAA